MLSESYVMKPFLDVVAIILMEKKHLLFYLISCSQGHQPKGNKCALLLAFILVDST